MPPSRPRHHTDVGLWCVDGKHSSRSDFAVCDPGSTDVGRQVAAFDGAEVDDHPARDRVDDSPDHVIKRGTGAPSAPAAMGGSGANGGDTPQLGSGDQPAVLEDSVGNTVIDGTRKAQSGSRADIVTSWGAYRSGYVVLTAQFTNRSTSSGSTRYSAPSFTAGRTPVRTR